MNENLNLHDSTSARVERHPRLDDRLLLKGRYFVEHFRNGKVINSFYLDNLITNEGKNQLFEIMFRNQTPIAAWFIGLIDASGFSAIAATDVMNSHAGWTESTVYSEANRQAWGVSPAANQSISNSAAPAVFTINGAGTIRGIFVPSNNTKGGTSGILWGAALFQATLTVAATDVVKITYTVSA